MLPTQEKNDPEMPSPTGPTLSKPLAPSATYTLPPTTGGPTTTSAPPPQQPGQRQAASSVGEILPRVELATLIDWDRLNSLVMFFAFMSFVACTLVQDRGQLENYQIAVGAASFGIAFLTMVGSLFRKIENQVVKIVLSLFQFLWWVQGVIVLTFLGSFQGTQVLATGYFGPWFAFIFATLMLITVTPFFEQKVGKEQRSPRKPLLLLLAASLVMVGAAIGPCSPQPNCLGYNAWALTLGSVSTFFSILLILLSGHLGAGSMAFVARFLVLFWLVGALVVIYGNPFTSTTTANGFFAALLGPLAAVIFLQSVTN